MTKYTDWATLDSRHAESIANQRALEESRTVLGVGSADLSDNAQRDAAFAEMLAGNAVNWGSTHYGITGDGVTDDRLALHTLANVTMQPNGGQLDIVGVVRIASDISIPANVTLHFIDGASLAPAVGVTVTHAGPILPTMRQIFGGAGSVVLTDHTMLMYPRDEWFGTGVNPDAHNIILGGSNAGTVINGPSKPVQPGGGCVIIGHRTLIKRTNPVIAIAIGDQAMMNCVDSDTYEPSGGGGNWSVAIGPQAGMGTAGQDVCAEGFVAIGEGALMSQTSGSANTAVGSLSLTSNTTGAGVVAVGSQALQGNTTGNDNTAMGAGTLIANTIGESNTAFGRTAMATQTTANNNTAVGAQASVNNVTGNDNTAVGYTALDYNTASQNTAVGSGAGQNTAVGIATNSAMTYVGYGATAIRSVSNSLAIGAGAQVVESNAAQIGSRSVVTFNFGAHRIGWDTAAPTTGSWGQGDQIFNSASAVGQPKGWACTASGAFPEILAGSGINGSSTIGSPVITGMSGTGGFNVGEYLTVWDGFGIVGDNRGLFCIAKTATTVTVDRNAASTAAVTVYRLAPTFASTGNL